MKPDHPTKRNPLARELAQPKYRQRIVRDKRRSVEDRRLDQEKSPASSVIEQG
jgi:hypothetical protein